MVGRHRILALACVVAIGGCQDGVASPSPALSAAASLAPVVTPSAPAPSPTTLEPALIDVVPPNADAPDIDGALGLSWSLAQRGDGHGTGIAHGPAGWLYVASDDGGGGPVVPRLLLSRDLRAWDEVRPDAPGIRGGSDWALAASDTAYVLSANGAWWSMDGSHWRQGEFAGASSGPIDVDGVASDGHGFVAWREFVATNGIWASNDGQAWSQIQLPGAPALIVDAVAARAAGGYVLAGRVGPTTAELDRIEGPALRWAARPGAQAVWTSDDGVVWLMVPLGTSFESMRITSIAAGGPGGGMIAVGQGTPPAVDGGIEPALVVWRWTDTAGWQRLLGQGFPTVERDAGSTRILAFASRWLLVGSRMRADARSVFDVSPPGVVAGSEDGMAWWAVGTVTLGSGAPEYYLDAIAGTSDRLVFLVNDFGPGLDEGHVQVWVSPSLPPIG